MNTITLTADELARWERGERTWVEAGFQHWSYANGRENVRYDPPVRWRDAVGPCPTCGGVGRHFTQSVSHDGPTRQCRDCRGTGKLLTELRAACTLPGDHDELWHPCAADVDGTGSVLVATVAVEITPLSDGQFEHLRLATKADNNADARAKGRHRNQWTGAIVFTEVPA